MERPVMDTPARERNVTDIQVLEVVLFCLFLSYSYLNLNILRIEWKRTKRANKWKSRLWFFVLSLCFLFFNLKTLILKD